MKSAGRRASSKKRILLDMLGQFRSGIMVVEGAHDVSMFKSFGVHALTYYSVMTGEILVSKKSVYIVMDNDRGGIDKADKLISRITELDSSAKIDVKTGPRFLKMIGVKAVEQSRKPLEDILES